ncbi:MAG: LysR family transcriptional regulator [Betaproteobacteria bacterium]
MHSCSAPSAVLIGSRATLTFMLSSVDLSCVEAIARHGELAAAARELKRDPSTLFRWLNALETRLGASLFSRIRGRYVPSQRNSAGYGGLLLGISDSFLHKDQVSAKTGQLHTPAGRAARNRAVNRLGQGLAPLAGTLSDPELRDALLTLHKARVWFDRNR